MEKLVTVATFDTPADAEVGKLLLEEKGIRAFLADDNLVGMNWFLSNAVGGVKLQVAASDVDQAGEILASCQTSKMPMQEEVPEESIIFACQECGKSITFPAERRGHVETCPECFSYVDVPDESETRLLAESGTREEAKALDANSRTTAQLWVEVSAILCLAYLPWLFAALTATGMPTEHSFVVQMLQKIVNAVGVSMPLLVIIALSKDRWSLFGIVRLKWIADVLVGCVICSCGVVFCRFAIGLLPLSTLEKSASLYVAHRATPEGVPAYFLLLTAFTASGSAQELIFRGYLIPRFERLLRSTWIAVLVTTVLFASFHVYQGTAGVIWAAAFGLVYAIAFCLLRRLWPLCLAHAISNFILYL